MRLIDADKLKEEFDQDDWGNYLDSEVRQIIDNASTVEQRDNFDLGYIQGLEDGKNERPHGKWIESDIPESILSKCSVCGFNLGAYTHNFCPNCGAKMDGGEEE